MGDGAPLEFLKQNCELTWQILQELWTYLQVVSLGNLHVLILKYN